MCENFSAQLFYYVTLIQLIIFFKSNLHVTSTKAVLQNTSFFSPLVRFETMQVGGTRLIDLLCSNLRDQTIGWDDIHIL